MNAHFPPVADLVDFNSQNSTKLSPNILTTIGDTPLVGLNRIFPASGFKLYGKMEAHNPGGSIKDRTAFNILNNAMMHGRIKKGDTIIESSSGNMAIGLAQVSLYFGINLIVVVDPKLNSQTEKILCAYGAKLSKVTEPHPTDGFLGARLERVNHLLNEIPRSFWTNQYGNLDNPRTHWQTMHEITTALNYQLDYIFIATSTCGMLMGCAEYVKENGLHTKIVAVDAEGSVIFGKKSKKRLIPGHGAGVKSQFLKREMITDVVHVSDQECVEGCQKLLTSEAILAGGSSGGMISAIEKYSSQIPQNATCAMIICDRGERYLETIYNPKWVKKNFPQLFYQTHNLKRF